MPALRQPGMLRLALRCSKMVNGPAFAACTVHMLAGSPSDLTSLCPATVLPRKRLGPCQCVTHMLGSPCLGGGAAGRLDLVSHLLCKGMLCQDSHGDVHLVTAFNLVPGAVRTQLVLDDADCLSIGGQRHPHEVVRRHLSTVLQIYRGCTPVNYGISLTGRVLCRVQETSPGQDT